MREVLLQTIVEKLESMEIALLKDSRSGNDHVVQKETVQRLKSLQSQLQIFNAQLSNNAEKLSRLSEQKTSLGLGPNDPSTSFVKHIHHFHKLVWVTAGLFLVCLLLVYGWLNCYKEKKSFEANDIKYRFWKSDSSANLLRLTYFTDSLYNLDKVDFRNRVVQREEQFALRMKMNRLAGEKKK